MKKLLRRCIAPVLCAGLPAVAMGASGGTFRWKNPLPVRVRDPQVQAVNGRYYLTGTAEPFFEGLGQSPGVPLWSSRDLLHWKALPILVRPSRHHWYKQRFWAPEIFNDRRHKLFYLTFNCPYGKLPRAQQCVGLAVAHAITGPYHVLTTNRPLMTGNDADLFRDTDGKTYCFVAGIWAAQVDLPHAKIIGKPFRVLHRGQPGRWDGASPGAPGVGIEGPSVIKIAKTYYLFYSSWGRGYEVGYATATNIRGPWKKYRHNPIYGAQGRNWCKTYKHKYTQKPGDPYNQVGHNSVFTGPDGRLWICAHAYRTKVDSVLDPHLVIDPLRFAHGVFHRTPVSWTPQRVRVKPGYYPPRYAAKATVLIK